MATKDLTSYAPISEWEGGDVDMEISVGEYGMAIAKIDEDQYAIVYGIEADENCNYTKFICDVFSYQMWLDEVRDPRSWVRMDEVCDCMGMSREEVESTPYRLFDALLGCYSYDNFFTNAWGYKEFTLDEVLACIERDNKRINEKMAA